MLEYIQPNQVQLQLNLRCKHHNPSLRSSAWAHCRPRAGGAIDITLPWAGHASRSMLKVQPLTAARQQHMGFSSVKSSIVAARHPLSLMSLLQIMLTACGLLLPAVAGFATLWATRLSAVSEISLCISSSNLAARCAAMVQSCAPSPLMGRCSGAIFLFELRLMQHLNGNLWQLPI